MKLHVLILLALLCSFSTVKADIVAYQSNGLLYAINQEGKVMVNGVFSRRWDVSKNFLYFDVKNVTRVMNARGEVIANITDANNFRASDHLFAFRGGFNQGFSVIRSDGTILVKNVNNVNNFKLSPLTGAAN